MRVGSADVWLRCRQIFFSVGVTVGLWTLVGASLLLARHAENQARETQHAVVETRVPADGERLLLRNKDDADGPGRPSAAVSASDGGAPVPMARPASVATVRLPLPKAAIGDAAPSRPDPAEFADVERFDACSPACESRDPLLSPVAVPYAATGPITLAGPVPAEEHAVVRIGLEVIEDISDASRDTIRRGGEYLVGMIDYLP